VSDVRLERSLKIPPVPAFASLCEILAAIAAHEGPWRGFTLHVALGDLRLPDVGYVAVPIDLTAGAADSTNHSLPIEFQAASHAGSFPRFTGTAGIDATGPTGATLWIDGSYDVPLQSLGKLFDATFAAGVARRALENLLGDLAAAVAANVEKREADYVRYHLY
jgi:hypothetical protein